MTLPKTVDDRLDELILRFDAHMTYENEWREQDKEWKDKAQPAIDSFNSLSYSWKFVIGIFASIGIIAGSVVALIKLFTKP